MESKLLFSLFLDLATAIYTKLSGTSHHTQVLHYDAITSALVA